MRRNQSGKQGFANRKQRPAPVKQQDDFISPLDFIGLEEDLEGEPDVLTQTASTDAGKEHQGLFVIGTDVGVGKTVAICVLGALLKEKNVNAGAIKPIDCGSQDVQTLREFFPAAEGDASVELYAFHEKLTPYFAFQKSQTIFDMTKTVAACRQAIEEHDMTLVEGPGGLLDPISDQHTTADVIKQLGFPVVVVAPLKRGTMNHLMMIARQAKSDGITIRGVLLTEADRSKPQAYFLAKMKAVQELVHIPVLGIIPFLEKGLQDDILEKCRQKVSFKVLMGQEATTTAVNPQKGRGTAEAQPNAGSGARRPRRFGSSRGRRRSGKKTG